MINFKLLPVLMVLTPTLAIASINIRTSSKTIKLNDCQLSVSAQKAKQRCKMAGMTLETDSNGNISVRTKQVQAKTDIKQDKLDINTQILNGIIDER
ncbi:TPA: hypothetical protein ACQFL4_003014 [Proteus mirabilis]|uniref:hypothetical protein n=1 Tax=Providencia sp. 2024EL-00732 TaxID=3374242 RepID=UPI00375757B4